MLVPHHISPDWISTEAPDEPKLKILENVEYHQAFTIPGNSELYRISTKSTQRVYARIISEGSNKGWLVSLPDYLIVNTYERKH